MPVETVLIGQSVIDFGTLINVTHQALGYNIASAADRSYRKLGPAEKFLLCLAGLRDETAETITADLLSHMSFNILVIAETCDLLSILELTSGMTFSRGQTTVPNVELAVISGTLLAWKNAVVTGTSETASPIVRSCFSKILATFDRADLTAIWQGYHRSPAPDRSGLLLKDMRR